MRSLWTLFGIIALGTLPLSACNRAANAPGTDPGTHADEHAHDHGHEGPHGGHIIELGHEDYHAELTHDDEAHRVGVYFLGSDAKTAKPIQVESITINASVDGEPAQYTLPAVPQEGEADGQSSYFEITSEPLTTIVSGASEQQTHARISLMIDGQPFVGIIDTAAHDHDHDHDHDHGHAH